jgi:hypothetical protein
MRLLAAVVAEEPAAATGRGAARPALSAWMLQGEGSALMACAHGQGEGESRNKASSDGLFSQSIYVKRQY